MTNKKMFQLVKYIKNNLKENKLREYITIPIKEQIKM
jgi:hypothetical protein